MTPTEKFVKENPSAPRGFFAAETAGLAWLAEAVPTGGVRVVQAYPVADDATQIEMELIRSETPPEHQAWAFGVALAQTHACGATHHGALPPATPNGPSFIATLQLPFAPPGLTWGEFYARYRVAPFIGPALDRGALSTDQARTIERVADRISAGLVPDVAPARLHGDLWSGNVLWAPEAVLIDPSAHGGHPETDLAMLALFGFPHLDAVLAGYRSHTPLAPERDQLAALHQLYPLLVHAVLFGGGYGAQAAAAAQRYR